MSEQGAVVWESQSGGWVQTVTGLGPDWCGGAAEFPEYEKRLHRVEWTQGREHIKRRAAPAGTENILELITVILVG